MANVDLTKRTAVMKIVFTGAVGAGKTGNLNALAKAYPEDRRGEVITLDVGNPDETSFECLRVKGERVANLELELDLFSTPTIKRAAESSSDGWTLPVSSFADSGELDARATVIGGADAVVFVADSDPQRMKANKAALAELKALLERSGRAQQPLVAFQWNKRDLQGAEPVKRLRKSLNDHGLPEYEASTQQGDGVVETLRGVVGHLAETLQEHLAANPPGDREGTIVVALKPKTGLLVRTRRARSKNRLAALDIPATHFADALGVMPVVAITDDLIASESAAPDPTPAPAPAVDKPPAIETPPASRPLTRPSVRKASPTRPLSATADDLATRAVASSLVDAAVVCLAADSTVAATEGSAEADTWAAATSSASGALRNAMGLLGLGTTAHWAVGSDEHFYFVRDKGELTVIARGPKSEQLGKDASKLSALLDGKSV